jgi:hypothetical protein
MESFTLLAYAIMVPVSVVVTIACLNGSKKSRVLSGVLCLVTAALGAAILLAGYDDGAGYGVAIATFTILGIVMITTRSKHP